VVPTCPSLPVVLSVDDGDNDEALEDPGEEVLGVGIMGKYNTANGRQEAIDGNQKKEDSVGGWRQQTVVVNPVFLVSRSSNQKTGPYQNW